MGVHGGIRGDVLSVGRQHDLVDVHRVVVAVEKGAFGAVQAAALTEGDSGGRGRHGEPLDR